MLLCKEWPDTPGDRYLRGVLRWMADKMEAMDLDGQIEYARGLSPEFKWYASFVSVGVFCLFYWPELIKLPFGSHHPTFFDAFPRGERGRRVGVVAPRGSAKSNLMVDVYATHCIVFAELYDRLGVYRDHLIFIASKNKNKAEERLLNIKTKLEVRFKHLVTKRWADDRAETANGILLLAASRGVHVRGTNYLGWRPTLICSDDLEDRDSLRNPDTAEKDFDWFYSDLIELGDNMTNYLNVDTVKAKDAICLQLKNSPNWNSHFIQAIPHPKTLLHPVSEALWEDYRRIWVDRVMNLTHKRDALDEFWSRNGAAMIKGVDETWPAKWNYRWLRERAFDQGMENVLREFQNYPEDRTMSLFKMEQATRFSVEQAGLRRSDGRMVRWGEFAGATVFLDYAGTSDQVANCFASVATVLWEPVPEGGYQKDIAQGEAYGYCWEVWLDRGPREWQLGALVDAYMEIAGVLAEHGVRNPEFYICCEGLIDMLGDLEENFRRHYESIRLSKGISEVLTFVPRVKRKEDRIANLEAPILNGWLSFHDRLDDEFWDQMEAFPNGKYVDGPDALEGAWSVSVVKSRDSRTAYTERVDELARRSRDVDEMMGGRKTYDSW